MTKGSLVPDLHGWISVAPCSSKGRPGAVKVIKGGQYECVRCGRRWPMSHGSTHPA